MVQFQRNNIIFRIASSDAISKFKAAQAHTFMQVARKELEFDTSTRETLLLEYERISQWVFRMERICFSVDGGVMALQLRQALMESFKEELKTIENVMDTHHEVFTPDVIKYIKMIHYYSFSMLYDHMVEQMNQVTDKAFVALVEIVTEYLQHILISLFEYNNNCINHKATPFIGVADFSFRCGDYDFVAIKHRADFFKNIHNINSFIIKNYSNRDHVFEDIKTKLASLDIELIPEEINNKSY